MLDYGLGHVELAMDAAVRRAMRDTATLRFATVTAVSGPYATLTLEDGASTPNVPVLSGVVVKVGSKVRLLSQGAQLLVIGAVGSASSVPAWAETANSLSVSATSLSPLSVPVRATFVAGHTGIVVTHVRGKLTPTATARVIVSTRILDETATSVIATEATPILEVPAGAGSFSLGGFARFTGLTPGTTYLADVTAASGTAGQTVTVAAVRLLAQPEM